MPARGVHLFDPTDVLKDLQHVVYEKKDRIAYITMNRPQSLNAHNHRMCLEMYSIWLDARRDKNVALAILTGTGRGFNVGRDVKEMAAHKEKDEIVPRDNPDSMYWHMEPFPSFAEFNKPIIAAINGTTAGSGLVFVGDSHIRVMAEDAYLTDGHPNFGNLGAPQDLVRDFGWTAASFMYLCFGRLPAQECFRLGIVNEICPKDKLMERAKVYADMMLKIDPAMLQHGVELMNLHRVQHPAETQLQEALNILHRDVGGEGQRLSKAFLDRKQSS